MISKGVAIILLLLAATSTAAQGPRSPKIALVLSGGGARGAAQIGVLKVLERIHMKPDIIVGSSFGAVVGGLWAAGYSADELDSIFRKINWDDITSFADDTERQTLFFAQKAEDDRSLVTLRFRDFAFVPPQALAGSARFSSTLSELLWQSPFNTEQDFDELACRFRAVATDLASGTWVALDRGNLSTAIQASASFPLRYAPVMIGDSMLVDGGLSANIPVDAALALEPDIVIIVNTTSVLAPAAQIKNALDVADQSLSIAMKQMDSIHLSKADYVITPFLDGIGTFDFSRIGESIDSGEVAAQRLQKTLSGHIRKLRYEPEFLGEPVTPEQRDSIMWAQIILNMDFRSTMPVRSDPVVDSLVKDMSGRNWSPAFFHHYREKLNRALREAGFPFAYIRAAAHDSAAHRLTMHVDGSRVNQIISDSLRPVRIEDIDRDLAFRRGDSLTVEALVRSADNLRASQLVTDVDLRVQPATDSGLAVVIGATDLGNQMVRVGARVDNERYFQGSLDLLQMNFLWTGFRFGVRGMLSPRIGSVNVTFEIPRISGTLWTTSIRGYASFRNVWIYQNEPDQPRNESLRNRVNEFSEDRQGVRLSAGRQLERNGVILGEFRYEQQRYRDISETPTGYQPLATAVATIRWDDRDRIDFATDGRVIDLFFETSILNLSNGLSFTKASAMVSYIFGIGDVALTPSFRIGAADKTLPGPELFSLGGQDLFFGMREDEERGRQIIVGNLDAMLKLPFSILFDTYLSVRYDIGAIWNVPEQIRIADLQHGIGATLGFETPVGPARFSIGRRFYFLEDPAAIAWGPFLGYFAIGVRL